MPGRTPASPLALAVLSLLEVGPLHPYGLQRLIRLWGKDTVVNVAQRASLYKTIARLEKAGLIAVRHTERDQRFPERTVYELTDAGRRQGREWLEEMVSTPRNEFPVLREPGSALVAIDTGDMWEVARIEAKVTGSELTDCIITPVHSKTPKPTKDGTTDVCVDTNPQNMPGLADATKWKFTASGGYPATADGFCWH